MSKTNAYTNAITLSALSSQNGAGLTYEHKEQVINCLNLCSDTELSQNLAAVIVLIRLMISYDEKARLVRCIKVFESGIGAYTGSDKNMMIANYERFIGLAQYNNIAEMTKHFKIALAHSDGSFAGEERIGNWTFGSPSVLLMFHRESGKLSEELSDMLEGIPVYCKLTDGHGQGADFVMEAEAKFNAGEFTEAETIIHKAWYYAREKDQWSIMITADFLRIRLLFIKGDWFGVVNIIKQTDELMEARKQSLLQHTFDMCKSYIYLLLDMPNKTSKWITEGDASQTLVMYPAKPALNIVYGRYLLATGEYAIACGIAEAARETASKFPNLLGIIYADIYLAAAHYALSREDEAKACLQSALDAALPDNILIPFAENAGFIMDILNELSKDEHYAESIARIKNLYKEFEKGRKKIIREHFAPNLGGLNEKEMEVTWLAAQRLTNKAIGDRLSLSEGAVKSRLINVFKKLSITKRDQLTEMLKL
ncbi:MAG: helix-turn-helix transcriptional regulator [Clostridiales bacterium]|nr:helix-turn-helix transcriptional regulator [Clostridiales bacterium]